MYKVNANIKELMCLHERTTEELKKDYNQLLTNLKLARNAYEFEQASEIKTEMVYLIQEIKSRKKELSNQDVSQEEMSK